MDDAAVVHLSSNYAEIVDKYYSVKGFLTVPTLMFFFAFFLGGMWLFSDDVSGSYDRKST